MDLADTWEELVRGEWPRNKSKKPARGRLVINHSDGGDSFVVYDGTEFRVPGKCAGFIEMLVLLIIVYITERFTIPIHSDGRTSAAGFAENQSVGSSEPPLGRA